MFLKSLFSREQDNARMCIDASRFDPGAKQKEEALIVFTQNEAESIYDRVSATLSPATGMVVIDLGSCDGTPYLAAEAGAVVVLQETAQQREAALKEAVRVALRMARTVRVCD